MLNFIKITLNFLSGFLGLAIMIHIVFFQNQDQPAENDDNDDQDDAAEAAGQEAEVAAAIAEDINENDPDDSWSDSSSIEAAFVEAHLMSQVTKMIPNFKKSRNLATTK